MSVDIFLHQVKKLLWLIGRLTGSWLFKKGVQFGDLGMAAESFQNLSFALK
jgi:hypothetical protein